jgi:hypothetical protein
MERQTGGKEVLLGTTNIKLRHFPGKKALRFSEATGLYKQHVAFKGEILGKGLLGKHSEFILNQKSML